MGESDNPTRAALSPQITRDYKVIRLLGKGGMGDVYLAEQLRVGHRPVALKVLNRSCCEDPDLKRRFENEAASAGRISHPNVVTVYECRATDDGQLYVAMQYVDGTDLGKLIEDRGPLPLPEVVEITKQAAAGIGAAHKLGIVHRDIKPANIMLARDDDDKLVVKVLDFGIARLSEPDSTGAQTKTGVVMGTPHYMSPEQAAGKTGDKIDRRSDVYSLAMAVYQMLTGKVAFESDSWMEVIYKHINEAPLPPSQTRPELGSNGPIDRVIMKGLEKDREKRYQNAVELANDLEAAYARLKSGGVRSAMYPGSGSTRPFSSAPATKGQPVPQATPAEPVSARTGLPKASLTTAAPAGGEAVRDIVVSRPAATRSTVPAAEAKRMVLAGSSAGKKIAAAVSAVILVALAAAAYVLTRGPVLPNRPPESARAAADPSQANIEAHRKTGQHPELADRTFGESSSPARAQRPLQDEPGRAERDPHGPSPAVTPQPPRPASEVNTGKAAGEGTCVGVTVTRGDGSPAPGFLLTLLDESTGKSYQTKTGARGMGRFCGLMAGRQVAVRLQGPKGKPLATRQLVLKAGLNPVEFQEQEDTSRKH